MVAKTISAALTSDDMYPAESMQRAVVFPVVSADADASPTYRIRLAHPPGMRNQRGFL